MICLATLTLATLGPWTYAGFLADPAPPVPPPAPAVPASPSFPPVPTPAPDPTPAPNPGRPPAPARATPPSPPVESSAPPPPVRRQEAAPVRYRMPDATGQVWEHSDPTWLQTYVMDRNRQTVRACVNGSCR